MYCYFSYQGLSFVYFTSFNNAHARDREGESVRIYARDHDCTRDTTLLQLSLHLTLCYRLHRSTDQP